MEKEVVAFGKLGRPPEDRLARQDEIFRAVAPLIVAGGARQLSMREAARAASLSIGGLYYYFPTKRELLLHGLCPAALLRYCAGFHAEFDSLTEADPRRYLEEGIRVVAKQAQFCRPSIQAALELGAESFWEVVETLLASTTLDFEVHLQQAAPEVCEEELHKCGRAIRRTIFAALLDRSMRPEELREELRILVDGYVGRVAVA
jgi:AcrR family transcriptional regulator